MIPYEELAAALAGSPAKPAPKFVQQATSIQQFAPTPIAAPDDSTLSGTEPTTGEVDVGDLLSDEEV